MSFSQDIKNEILKNKVTKKCCLNVLKEAELLTEHEDIDIVSLKKKIKENSCCKKAFLKGIFLGSGCIVMPNTDYHFEVTAKSKKNATAIIYILNNLIGFNAKIIKRNISTYVIYIKDSEEISSMLSYIGASCALMEFEKIRVEKSVKNNINRTINCETANQAKTMSAAFKQIQAIDILEKNNIIDKLPRELKNLCKLRKENPNLSLDGLANLSKDNISKSGINHRLNKIIALSKNIK